MRQNRLRTPAEIKSAVAALREKYDWLNWNPKPERKKSIDEKLKRIRRD